MSGLSRASGVALIALLTVALVACGGSSAPGTEAVGPVAVATYEFTIPPGAGEALDAGTPLEILPAELDVRVGETIRIVNEDARGHTVGPFFVGANETLTQRFSSPGEFVGVCTVHPSGEIVLKVSA
jgi:plastocyanin